jgi:hypothetical protein
VGFPTGCYAERVDAALLVTRHAAIPPADEARLAFYLGRGQKLRCTMLKILYLRDALAAHEEAVLFDDTCFIAPSRPDIFDAAAGSALAAVPFRRPRPGAVTYNMGVLRTSQALRPFLADFEREYLRQGRPRTEADVINNAIQAGRIPCAALDPRFNRVGSQIARAGIDRIDAWVYHLTSFLHDKIRIEYAEGLARRFADVSSGSTKRDWEQPRVRWVGSREELQ